MVENKRKKYIIGDKQDWWTIIDSESTNGRKKYIVKCECGELKKTTNPFESKSCGCNGRLFGYFGRKVKCGYVAHGQSNRNDPNRVNWYHRWKAMMRRCHVKTDKQYYNYGARGIKVCNRWLKRNGIGSENYYNDVHEILGPQPSPDHSLDRIDNNGMYEISNLRWATNVEQAKNRRISLKMKSQDTNYKLDL